MDFGTYLEWAFNALVPFGIYMLGGCILLILIAALVYIALYIGWLCYIVLTIKGNLFYDKLKEQSDRELQEFLDKQDNGKNG